MKSTAQKARYELGERTEDGKLHLSFIMGKKNINLQIPMGDAGRLAENVVHILNIDLAKAKMMMG